MALDFEAKVLNASVLLHRTIERLKTGVQQGNTYETDSEHRAPLETPALTSGPLSFRSPRAGTVQRGRNRGPKAR